MNMNACGELDEYVMNIKEGRCIMYISALEGHKYFFHSKKQLHFKH